MGWTVLYIAFGCVALWLLGEVLLQYKARLRWRLLAFFGFVGVVLGVLVSSIPVIVVGTAAFATGQLFVTLSFRRGFSTGWALGGKPGSSRRRRREGAESDAVPPAPLPEAEPVLEVSDLEETATYQPLPLPDDTGQYGVYRREDEESGAPPYAGEQPAYGGYPGAQDGYGAPDPAGQGAYATAGYDPGGQRTAGYGAEPGRDLYSGSPLYAAPARSAQDPYGYGSADHAYGTEPYAADSYGDTGGGGTYGGGTGYGGEPYGGGYAEPYPGAGQTQPMGAQDYGPGANDLYDPLSGGYPGDPAPYGTPPYGTGQPYAGGYQPGYDTGSQPPVPEQAPPGGPWVPPQREADPAEPPPYPPQQPDGYGYYGSQQRY